MEVYKRYCGVAYTLHTAFLVKYSRYDFIFTLMFSCSFWY